MATFRHVQIALNAIFSCYSSKLESKQQQFARSDDLPVSRHKFLSNFAVCSNFQSFAFYLTLFTPTFTFLLMLLTFIRLDTCEMCQRHDDRAVVFKLSNVNLVSQQWSQVHQHWGTDALMICHQIDLPLL